MNTDEVNANECRCPTCRATQAWSDECRRCGTDISLLRRLADEVETLRKEGAGALQSGDRCRAKSIAERLRNLSPTKFHEMLYDFVR